MQAAKPCTHAEFLAQRQRYSRIDKRDNKIAALLAANNPDARKQRRAMNDQVIPKRQGALGEFFLGQKGHGKIKVRGKCDARRVQSKLNAAGCTR